MGLQILPLAQEAVPAPGNPSGQLFQMIIFMALIFGVIYFLILRPQKKKESERKQMLNRVKRGDRVVTIGGIHAEVENVKEHTVILLVDPDRKVTLKMSRSAVHKIVEKDSDEETQE